MQCFIVIFFIPMIRNNMQYTLTFKELFVLSPAIFTIQLYKIKRNVTQMHELSIIH